MVAFSIAEKFESWMTIFRFSSWCLNDQRITKKIFALVIAQMIHVTWKCNSLVPCQRHIHICPLRAYLKVNEKSWPAKQWNLPRSELQGFVLDAHEMHSISRKVRQDTCEVAWLWESSAALHVGGGSIKSYVDGSTTNLSIEQDHER